MTKSLKIPSTTRRAFAIGSAAAVTTFFIHGIAKADPDFTLKIASVAPNQTPWSAHLKKVKKRVQDGSAGRVKVKTHLGGSLGGEVETLARVKTGSIHLWGGTSGALASQVPEIAALELPYLFSSRKKADAVLDNAAVRSKIEGLLDKSGFKLLFYSENGYRSVGANFGAVKSPADLKGKKMRSQQGDVHLNTWRALGASPVPISVTETLTALQTGVVDGFDNTPLFAFAGSWYQAITHFSLTRHSYQPGFVIASKKVWKDLPVDIQALLQGDFQAEAERGRKGVRALRKQLIDNFSAAGVEVYKPTDAEIAGFKRATAPTHKKFGDKFGRGLLNLVKKTL